MYRVFFFDLDDTLFDRTAALRGWVASHLGSLDAEALAWVIELDDRGRRPRPHFAAAVLGIATAWLPRGPWVGSAPPRLTIRAISELERHA